MKRGIYFIVFGRREKSRFRVKRFGWPPLKRDSANVRYVLCRSVWRHCSHEGYILLAITQRRLQQCVRRVIYGHGSRRLLVHCARTTRGSCVALGIAGRGITVIGEKFADPIATTRAPGRSDYLIETNPGKSDGCTTNRVLRTYIHKRVNPRRIMYPPTTFEGIKKKKREKFYRFSPFVFYFAVYVIYLHTCGTRSIEHESRHVQNSLIFHWN